MSSMETLRDQFAMAALTGMLADCGDARGNLKWFAETAYLYADAMMKAREAKG